MTGPDTIPRLRAADVGWLLVVLAITAAVYAPSLAGELVYDDLLLIGRNPLITDLARLPSLIGRPYWDFIDPGASQQIGYWRPLAAAMHAVGWAMAQGEPWAFHALSVSLHLGATAAAFFLARRLARSVWVGAAVALLFGVHPLHVESVAWISALNDPLFGVWSLASLALYLRWRDRGSRGVPVGAGAGFLLALLSKEMGICVLPMLAAIDLGRTARRATDAEERGPEDRARGWLAGFEHSQRAYAPFAAALLVYLAARMVVFESLVGGFDRTPVDFGVSWARLLLLRLELLGGSLVLLAWPQHLVAFRPFRPDLSWLDPTILAAGGATAALLLWLAWTVARRRRLQLAALALIPLGFSPVLISVGSLGRFPLSDRFLYVPVLGFVLLVAMLVRRFLPRPIATGGVLVVAALYAVKSHERIGVWSNEERLFRAAVDESPRSAYLRWGLGRVLLKRLGETEDPRYLKEAFAAFEGAGDLLIQAKGPEGADLFVTSTDYLQTNLGLGLCYVFEAEADDYGSQSTAIAVLEELARKVAEIQGQKDEARALGIRVVELDLDLELVYTALGTAYRFAGRYDDSEEALRKALQYDPLCVEAHTAMARLFSLQGEWDGAVHHLTQAADLQRGNYETQLMLAQTLREAGQRERAEAIALELIRRDPSIPEAMLIVASNRLEDRNGREALVYIDQALAADPEHGHAWFFKGMAMQSLDVNPQATIDAFRRATEYDPDHFLAHYNYGTLLLGSGAPEASLPYLVRAYELTDDAAHLGPLLAVLGEMPFEEADGLFRLAAADGKRGRENQAELWLDRAIELDPEHADSLFQKARLLRGRERHDEALDLLRRAAASAPESLVVHTELGGYLIRRDLFAEARRVLEGCLEFPRPDNFSEEEFEAARKQVREMLARIAENTVPEATIGPERPAE